MKSVRNAWSKCKLKECLRDLKITSISISSTAYRNPIRFPYSAFCHCVWCKTIRFYRSSFRQILFLIRWYDPIAFSLVLSILITHQQTISIEISETEHGTSLVLQNTLQWRRRRWRNIKWLLFVELWRTLCGRVHVHHMENSTFKWERAAYTDIIWHPHLRITVRWYTFTKWARAHSKSYTPNKRHYWAKDNEPSKRERNKKN